MKILKIRQVPVIIDRVQEAIANNVGMVLRQLLPAPYITSPNFTIKRQKYP